MAIRIKFNEVNRFKKTRGFSRKEIARPERKYADVERWKRVKNVAIQRQSRFNHEFDSENAMIPRRTEEWPYEGISDYMEGLRKKNPLGAGW
jgi:hypothetical protein